MDSLFCVVFNLNLTFVVHSTSSVPPLPQHTLKAIRETVDLEYCVWVGVQTSLSHNIEFKQRGKDSTKESVLPYIVNELCGCYPLQ